MKKSTKVSLVLLGVGVIVFTLGIIMSGREIVDAVRSGNVFSISSIFRHNGLGRYKNITDEKFSRDIEKIMIDANKADVFFAESDDDYIHVAYGSNYKNIFDIREHGKELEIIGIDNHVDLYTSDDDEYLEEYADVDISSDGVYVDNGETNVSIDEDGVNVIDDEASVSIGTEGINITNFMKNVEKGLDDALTAGKMVIYIPKSYKGNIECKTVDANIIMSGIIASEIEAYVEQGDIIIEKLDALKKVDLNTTNGDVVGTMRGKINDYNMNIMMMGSGHTDLPTSNPSDGPDLTITTHNGDVNVDFFN